MQQWQAEAAARHAVLQVCVERMMAEVIGFRRRQI